jgi:hypothetical protein
MQGVDQGTTDAQVARSFWNGESITPTYLKKGREEYTRD